MKYTQLYSVTPGNRPDPSTVETGEIWINIADGVIGTKNENGELVQLAVQGDFIPKSGAVEDITSSPLAKTAETNSISINDESPIAIRYTLTADGATITCSKTTGDKAVKLTLVKPEGVTCTVNWEGVDEWLSTSDAPVFGSAQTAQELCVAVFSSPTFVVVNTVYNTENPTETDVSMVEWGQLYGDISNQTDLTEALAAKADKLDLAQYATANNATLTGTATLNGSNIATIDTVNSALADYATTETVEAEFASYDKNIKAHIENELGDYLPLTGGTLTGSVTLPADPTQNLEAATKQYVDVQISDSNTKFIVANATQASDKMFTDYENATNHAKAGYGIADSNFGSGSGSLSGGMSVANSSNNFTSSIGIAVNDSGTGETGMYIANASGEQSSVRVLDGQVVFTEKNAATKLIDLAKKTDLDGYLPLTGGTLTGALKIQTPTESDNPATKAYVDSAVSSVLKYKGTVADEAALPDSGNTTGDVWTTQNNNKEYAWDGTEWIELGPTVDLSGYLTIANASTTYLTKSDASSTYQVAGDYATNSALTSGLATKLDVSTYNADKSTFALKTEIPSLDGYLTEANASTTYATKTELSSYAPLANPAFTGTATLGGQIIATVNQIPDVSGFLTADNAALNYATKTELHNKADASVLNSYVLKGGNRGTLAGYEGINVSSSAITVDSNSSDSQQVTSAVTITVANGNAGESWTKKVSIKNASASISLGSSWNWAGGSTPTVTAPSLLVLSWDNDVGIAILQATA